MNPQLALRVAVMGAVAFVFFAVILFRLWSLQILSGAEYLAEANTNRVRTIEIEAPRGRIVDRSGAVLVDNVPGNMVRIAPEQLPLDARGKAVVYARLARALGVNRRRMRREIQAQLRAQPYSPATVMADAPFSIVAYLKERADLLPGVVVEQTTFRRYPRHELAAQLVGYIGQVSEESLRAGIYPGVKQGERVGITGIEAAYDRFLRGRRGISRVQVDSLGNPHGVLRRTDPMPGDQLRLTLDLAVQRTGQDALRGAKGAFVVMDVKTGAVRALGSSPSYDPNVFSRRLRQSDFDRLSSKANGEPLVNRATNGLYPAGSTFKLVTSLAGLDTGQITPSSPITDNGSVLIGNVRFKNAGATPHGQVALRKALQVSSDVYYYLIGRDDDGTFAIQKWAKRLGFGKPTGIDLPSEGSGLVPTEKRRNRLFAKGELPEPWTVGHQVNTSVGQGDVQINPLQLAVAYAAIGNGGYVVRPHLAAALEDADGAVVREFRTPRRKRIAIRAEWRTAILEGLRDAARRPGGTSYPVFAKFPFDIAGKTGTAETCDGCEDQSWYVLLAPYRNPRYVIAVTSERGGFGAEAAAPAACEILTTLMNVRRKGACSAAEGPVNAD